MRPSRRLHYPWAAAQAAISTSAYPPRGSLSRGFSNVQERGRALFKKTPSSDTIGGGSSGASEHNHRAARASKDAAEPSSAAVAQRTLHALSERGGAHVLLSQMTPLSAELREVSLSTLAVYVRSVPSAITQVEERLALLIPIWMHSEGGAATTVGTFTALLRLAASHSEPTRLERPTLPTTLLSALPTAPSSCQCAALTALLPFIDSVQSAAVLLSDELSFTHLLDIAQRIGNNSSSSSKWQRHHHHHLPRDGLRRRLLQFGDVHVSLLLRCKTSSSSSRSRQPSIDISDAVTSSMSPSSSFSSSVVATEDITASSSTSTMPAKPSDDAAPQLSVRVLASLLRHALELPDGWHLLPLIHALLDQSQPPAVTSHVLLVLCCRTLAALERPLLSGDCPPLPPGLAAGSAAPNADTYDGAVPPKWSTNNTGPLNSALSRVFWPNLTQFLFCLDQLLLRSHAVWLAGGGIGQGGSAGTGIGDLGPSDLLLATSSARARPRTSLARSFALHRTSLPLFAWHRRTASSRR